MKPAIPTIDLDAYPPFEGFPKEGIRFLRELKRNNNREWFGSNKHRYEEFVRLPMESLIASIAGPLEKLAPEFLAHPKKSMFRIYRDTRFSRNKEPYKTHASAIFHPRGHWEESAGFYLHIEPGEVFLGGGIYMPDGAQLKKIRAAIAQRPKAFLAILSKPSFRKTCGTLDGEKLTRAPLGYKPEHPMIEWLKFKQFFVSSVMPESAAMKRDFIPRVMKVFSEMNPLVQFLNGSLHRK